MTSATVLAIGRLNSVTIPSPARKLELFLRQNSTSGLEQGFKRQTHPPDFILEKVLPMPLGLSQVVTVVLQDIGTICDRP